MTYFCIICLQTLQEEIRSQQPHLNALQRQFEQAKQHATPEGVRDLKNKQDNVKAKWEKLSADASERQSTVNGALRHRQDFLGKLNEFEKWLKKTQRKLDTGNEIYSDEPLYNALVDEFKELVRNCNEDEAARAPDKVRKMNFNRLYLCYFLTKSYVWPLVRIVSTRRF